MIISRLWMTTLFVTVLHTATNSLNEDPKIIREYIHVNVGKRVRMECELGNSIKSVNMKGLWLRLEDAEIFFYSISRINPDQRFQLEQRPILHIVNSTSSYEVMTYSLTIDDVRLSDDGTYSCQSDNRIIKQFVLNVVERPYFVTHEYTTLLRTQVGKNVSIACEAQGKPSPYVSWMKKMDDNQQKIMINCTTTPTTCQLNLVDISRWHHGIYECVAMNSIATISRPYELDVHFPPDVYTSTLRSFHSIGETVTFECLIDGNPEPDIRWLHRLSNDDTDQIVDLTRLFHQDSLNPPSYHHKSDNDRPHTRRQSSTWSLRHEQINATRWKTTLTVKHLSKRWLNSDLICRAVNRYGSDEKSIKILPSQHYAPKRHRHTTTLKSIISSQTLTAAINQNNQDRAEIEYALQTETIDDSAKQTVNGSIKATPYLFYTFILGLYLFVKKNMNNNHLSFYLCFCLRPWPIEQDHQY